LGPFGLFHGNEVLDAERIEHLPTEALGDETCANAFPCSVDRRRRTGRAAADDEHIEGLLGIDPLGLSRACARIELGEDLLDGHATLREHFAVQEDGRYGHDLALLGFLLEERAVD